MPDKKIGAFGSGVPAQAADLIPISRSPFTVNLNVTAQSIANLAPIPAFSAITAGTNPNALIISGSLAISGGGTIVATSVPFSGVSAATNTVALVIGNSGTLMVSGSGVIQATQIQGVVVSGTPPTAGQILTAQSSTTADWETPTPADGISIDTQNSSVSAYTATAADANNLVTMDSASASTFTVPPNSSVAYAIGTVLGVQQLGAGQITLTVAGSPPVPTINTPSSLTTRARYSTIGVVKVATDVWTALGDLT